MLLFLILCPKVAQASQSMGVTDYTYYTEMHASKILRRIFDLFIYLGTN